MSSCRTPGTRVCGLVVMALAALLVFASKPAGTQDRARTAEPASDLPQLVWEYETGGGIVAPLALDESGVYVGSRDRFVYAIERDTGALRWKAPTRGHIRGGPAVLSGRVYIGSSDHALYCLDARNGRVMWRFPTAGAVLGMPAVAEGCVVFGSNDHHVYCLDAKTGALRWRHETGDTVECRPAMDGGRVFIGSGDNHIYALDLETGHPRWIYACRSSVDGALTLNRGLILASSRNGVVHALDAETGKAVWRCATGGTLEAFPVPGENGYIFLGGGHRNGTLSCLTSFGRLVWRSDLGGSAFGPVAQAGGLVWGGSSTSVVAGIDPRTGRIARRVWTGAPVYGGVRSTRGVIYWSDENGKVCALRVSD